MEAWRGTMVNGNGTIVGNLRSERGIASFYKSKSNKGHFKATISQKMERCHGQRQREESIKRWQAWSGVTPTATAPAPATAHGHHFRMEEA
jgi:hypothetical protein